MLTIPVRLVPTDHVTIIQRHRLELVPRTTCYGHLLVPLELRVAACQHPKETTWTVTQVELSGYVVVGGVMTTTTATALYEFDPDDEPMPAWLPPLIDQIKAGLDRLEPMA